MAIIPYPDALPPPTQFDFSPQAGVGAFQSPLTGQKQEVVHFTRLAVSVQWPVLTAGAEVRAMQILLESLARRDDLLLPVFGEEREGQAQNPDALTATRTDSTHIAVSGAGAAVHRAFVAGDMLTLRSGDTVILARVRVSSDSDNNGRADVELTAPMRVSWQGNAQVEVLRPYFRCRADTGQNFSLNRFIGQAGRARLSFTEFWGRVR